MGQGTGLDIIAACRWTLAGGVVTIDGAFKVRSAAYSVATGAITFVLDDAVGPLDLAWAQPKSDPPTLLNAPTQGQVADAFIPGPGNAVVVRTYPLAGGAFAAAPRSGQMMVCRGFESEAIVCVLGP